MVRKKERKMKGKKLVAAVLSAFIALNPALPAMAYSDAGGSEYSDAIAYVSQKGLMTGYQDGLFHPQDAISRGMVATILYRMMGSPKPAGQISGFDDVPEWSYYKMASTFMKDTGIMSGNLHENGTTTFDGEDAVRRADLALIFYRLIENNIQWAPGVSNPFVYNTGYVFGDVPSSHYAYNALDWAQANNLLEKSGNRIDPSVPGTRAVTANFLFKVLTTMDHQDEQEAMIPDYYAPVNPANVLLVLDHYDPDGAWILRKTVAKNDYMEWMDKSLPILERIETAVHEQTHVLTRMSNVWTRNDYYVGNGQTITVNMGNVFDSVEMVPILDPTLNDLSFRFDTYVSSKAEAIVGSRQQGIYGLFNEFTAYCWGANTKTLTWDVYLNYVHRYEPASHRLMSSSEVEYCEFMYWMLSWMQYAKDHYPAIYSQVLANTEFKRAFKIVDDKFQSVLAAQKSLELFSHYSDETVQKYRSALQKDNLRQIYSALRG